jgi:cold shock CspA family protein
VVDLRAAHRSRNADIGLHLSDLFAAGVRALPQGQELKQRRVSAVETLRLARVKSGV